MEPQPPSHELEETFCPYYTHAVELVGRRWSGAIVRALLLGCLALAGLLSWALSRAVTQRENSVFFGDRVIDGAPAARFLQTLRQLIEQPFLGLV